MKKVTVEYLTEHPQDFIVSCPETCAPCRQLEKAFEELDFPWLELNWRKPGNEQEFLLSNDLPVNGIPSLIIYRDPSTSHSKKKFWLSAQSPFDHLKPLLREFRIDNQNRIEHAKNID